MARLALVLGGLMTGVSASANGALYECTTVPSTYCVFKQAASSSVAVSEHSISMTVASPGFRTVVNAAGTQLQVSAMPWTQGDTLAASSSQLQGELLAYSLMFQLVAPLRDAMMYHPDNLGDSQSNWDGATKAFTDCGVKLADDSQASHYAYSTTNTYAILKGTYTSPTVSNGSPSSDWTTRNHNILQYLEEGAIDLVCRTTTLVMDRCDTIRTAQGQATGTVSDCWVPAYTAFFGAPPSAWYSLPTTLAVTTTTTTAAATTATTLMTTAAATLMTTAAAGPGTTPAAGMTTTAAATTAAATTVPILSSASTLCAAVSALAVLSSP